MPKIAVGISIFLLALSIFAIWVLHPPLRVFPYKGGKVIVDVQTLGEYKSSLSSFELTECTSGNILWRLEPLTDPIELWAFPLKVGKNPSTPIEGFSGYISEEWLLTAELSPTATRADFQAVIPKKMSAFTLNSGTCYRITIEPVGKLKRLFRATETFMIQ